MTKLIKRSWNWSLSASVLGIALILIWVVPVGAQINQNFGNPGGSGTVSGQAAHAISVGTGATTVGSTAGTPPSTNGQYTCGYTVTGSTAVDPTCPLVGLIPNQAAGATVLYSDNNSEIRNPAAALSLPTPTTLGNANFFTTIINSQATTSTITPVTWTISLNGATAGATAVVPANSKCSLGIDQVASTQWDLDCGPVGTGGSTITCSTADAFVYWLTATTGACDSGITTNTSGQVSATGGFVAVSDGVHAGIDSLIGNTTAPAIPSNSAGWIGPNSASFTAYMLQLPSTAPTTAAPLLSCVTPVSSVSACTFVAASGSSTVAFTAQTDGATVTWAIGSALVANASLTFTVHSGSRTLNITNPVNGGSYVLWIKQDATGGEGLTLGTGCTWKVSGGGAGTVTPSAGAGAVDILAFTYDGTNCYANFNKNFN